MGKEEDIAAQMEESICLKRYLQEQVGNLMTIANQLVHAFRRENKVLLFGNGGGAAAWTVAQVNVLMEQNR